ncbi:MAG: protein kinase domain-containing protein [Gemmatimonadaceae bacterium]
MPDSLDRLKSAISDHYVIERELGHGAMATVYLARDVKLNREVAIKVLLPELGFVLGPERFRREIEVATKMSHPHILPIYDSGEAAGELYYVMPYVAGESLRARLFRERQLSLDEALRIAAEVASALDHSHRHGIIHRDIKPENILLEDGQALVADFGIARAVSSVGEGKLTSTGISLGTPAYMSPEQGMADPNLDGRTDIYSLGCVLYEMLAGSPPFTGRTTQALIARHSLDAVPSLSIVRQTIPEDVEDVVMCALAKVPADRFATAGDFANALNACRQGGTVSIRRTRGTRARGKPRKWGVIAGAVALGIVAITGAAWAGKAFILDARRNAGVGAERFRPQRIAVLYFNDLSTDKHLGYLADGLTESLIGQLGAVSALDVISAGGVKQFRGEEVPRDSIARALEAGTLVDGNVVPEGKNVRVTMRIIDGNNGALASDPTSVVEPLANPLALKTKLAEQLSLMLRQTLRDEIRLRELRVGTQNPNAWSLVQQAENLRKGADSLDQSGNPGGAASQLATADTMLVRAESLDPRWTEPLVLRARIAGRQERLTTDPAESAKWISSGIAYADSAIALDPRDADALELRGTLRVRPIDRGFVEDQRKVDDLVRLGEQDLRAAIAVNPTQAGALSVLSFIQYLKHDAVESHNLAQRAYEADAYLTAAPAILWRLYVTSYDLESFVNAQKWCDEETLRFPHHFLSARCQLWIMTAKGIRPDPDQAWRRAAAYALAAPPLQREYYRREGQIVVADVLGRAALADSARRTVLADSARRVLVRARTTDRTIDPRGELMGYEAFVRAQLGDKKEAVDLLQRYLTDHPEHRGGFAKVNAWWWRDLQSDPRFRSLIATGG